MKDKVPRRLGENRYIFRTNGESRDRVFRCRAVGRSRLVRRAVRPAAIVHRRIADGRGDVVAPQSEQGDCRGPVRDSGHHSVDVDRVDVACRES